MTAPATLEEAADRYLEIRAGHVSANTLKGDRTAVTKLVEWIGASTPPGTLTREMLDRVLYGPGGLMQDTSAASANSYLSRLRRFTQTAVSYGWLDRDPLAGMHGRRREIIPPRQLLSPRQMLDLVEAAKSPRDRIAIALAVNTALRGSEIADLMWADVDLDQLWLTVRIRKTADGTAADTDTMPITEDLATEIRIWKYVQERDHPVISEHYLVPQQRWVGSPGRYVYAPSVPIAEPQYPVKRALEMCGLPSEKEGMHTVRRSVGRAYYEMLRKQSGHESALVATAALLHHKDIRQTLHYIGVVPERHERNELLRGRPFLSAMTDAPVPLIEQEPGDAE